RGGIVLRDGAVNPLPLRNFPWGKQRVPCPANLAIDGVQRVAAVGTHPDDVSPYGVQDMGGNAQEWTDSVPPRGQSPDYRVVRGGDYCLSTPQTLAEDMALANARPAGFQAFNLARRCVPVCRVIGDRTHPPARCDTLGSPQTRFCRSCLGRRWSAPRKR